MDTVDKYNMVTGWIVSIIAKQRMVSALTVSSVVGSMDDISFKDWCGNVIASDKRHLRAAKDCVRIRHDLLKLHGVDVLDEDLVRAYIEAENK